MAKDFISRPKTRPRTWDPKKKKDKGSEDKDEEKDTTLCPRNASRTRTSSRGQVLEDTSLKITVLILTN